MARVKNVRHANVGCVVGRDVGGQKEEEVTSLVQYVDVRRRTACVCTAPVSCGMVLNRFHRESVPSAEKFVGEIAVGQTSRVRCLLSTEVSMWMDSVLTLQHEWCQWHCAFVKMLSHTDPVPMRNFTHLAIEL